MGRNTCAQRLASRLTGAPAAELEATHPPDTPFRLLGTTPDQLARMLTRYGRPYRAERGGRPQAGDAVCVDLRPLRGGIPRLHWMLIEATRPDALRLDGRWYAREAFDRAWACRWSPFPMHRRARVTPGHFVARRGKAISSRGLDAVS